MQILSIGNFTTGWDNSICDEEHIAKALEDLGHEVTRGQRESIVPEDTNYDFVLIAQWNGYAVDMVAKLKNIYECPIIYWAFDYQMDKNGEAEPEEWHVRLVNECDLFLSKEIAHKQTYERMGAKFRWLAQDFAPQFLDIPTQTFPKEYDVVFTGSHLPYAPERTKLLKLVDSVYDLHVFSVTPEQWKAEGLKNVHPPIMDRGLPELYAKAKINLSIDWKYSTGYWSDRNAQIMACKGFVLFRHVPMSEAVFRDYIEYFHTPQQCLDKIDYYLKNEKEREQISAWGYQYAQNNLKVINRVKDMLVLVGEILGG